MISVLTAMCSQWMCEMFIVFSVTEFPLALAMRWRFRLALCTRFLCAALLADFWLGIRCWSSFGSEHSKVHARWRQPGAIMACVLQTPINIWLMQKQTSIIQIVYTGPGAAHIKSGRALMYGMFMLCTTQPQKDLNACGTRVFVSRVCVFVYG